MKWWMVFLMAMLVGCSAPPEDEGEENSVVIITNNENSQENNTATDCESTDDCADGEACVDGYCQLEGCEPQCDGMTCGPNGCGGVCGTCEGRESCVDGACDLEPADCSGFAAEPTMWSVPQLFVDDQLYLTANGSGDCGGSGGYLRHATMDLTGDGLPDLVVTDKCDEAGVGTNRWEVYENTGSGFAAEPTMWSVPELFVDDQLYLTANGTGDCGSSGGYLRHTTLDLNGDGLPDLVVTDKCDEAGVGTNRWEVYENTGSGFAAEPTTWSVPELFVDDQLYLTANGTGDCGGEDGYLRHQLADMDADGLTDLLITDRCDGAGVGTNRWEYYRNQGDGFAAEPTMWSTPEMFVDDQLYLTANGSGDCGGEGGYFRHQMMDIDGDALQDLVVSDKCDGAGVGTNRWEVYSADCQ
jgi:hypothetical protein